MLTDSSKFNSFSIILNCKFSVEFYVWIGAEFYYDYSKLLSLFFSFN